MEPHHLAALVVLAITIGSRLLYDHRDRHYAAGKQQRAPFADSFRYVYGWVRWSTPVVGIGALLSEHPAWLVVHGHPVAMWFGLAIASAAFGLFVWSKRTLGRHYSPCYDVWIPTQVVRTGPYAHVRHPIYTANLGILAGLAIGTGSLWLLVNLVLVGAFYVPSARREELALAACHDDYADYMRHSGRFWPRWPAR